MLKNFSSPVDCSSEVGVGTSSWKKVSRWSLLPLGTGLLLALILLTLSYKPNWVEAGHKWVFFLDWPVFGDLAITMQHFHEADAGLDPLGDPESAFAYPRAVLALRHLGLHHIPTQWIGFLQACFVTFAIVILIRPTTPNRAFATMLLFFSPALVHGFEKANLDFALFLLCVLGAELWARARTGKGLMWPIAGFMLGAILKLHPIFALLGGAVADTARRRWIWLMGAALIFAYWAFNQEEMALIAQKIPIQATWGCLLIFTNVERFFSADRTAFVWLVDVKWPLIAVITYAVAVVAASYFGMRLAAGFRSLKWERREWCSYWIGAAICCGSFAGSNYGHRWIFLVLALPLLFRLAHAPDRGAALWSRLTLGFVFASLLAPLVAGRTIYVLTQFANWSCIFLLIVGCVSLRLAAQTTSSRSHRRLATSEVEPLQALTPLVFEAKGGEILNHRVSPKLDIIRDTQMR